MVKFLRKTRKHWRKNVDLQEIEQGLDEKREQEKYGTLLNEQKSSQLFTIDKTGNEIVKKRAKGLKIDDILKSTSKLDAIMSRPTKKKSNVLAKDHRISKAQLALAQKIQPNKSDASAKSTPKPNDLWEQRESKNSNEYLKVVEPPKFVKPSLPNHKNKSIVAEKAMDPTLVSYNPEFQEHQKAVQLAIKEEEAKQQEQQKWKNKLAYPAELDELPEDMLVDDGQVSEYEEAVGNAYTRSVTCERKTKAQRNKEKKRKEKELELRKQKEQKKILKQITQVKKISKEIPDQPQPQTKDIDPKKQRLGPLKYQPIPSATQIPLVEDLADSMRGIKPEGNLFKETFKALEEKGVIEPRLPTNIKRKYKLKEIEVHSYKRFK